VSGTTATWAPMSSTTEMVWLLNRSFLDVGRLSHLLGLMKRLLLVFFLALSDFCLLRALIYLVSRCPAHIKGYCLSLLLRCCRCHFRCFSQLVVIRLVSHPSTLKASNTVEETLVDIILKGLCSRLEVFLFFVSASMAKAASIKFCLLFITLMSMTAWSYIFMSWCISAVTSTVLQSCKVS